MEFISVGQHAQGVVAIGQHATGVIAIGQEATGFVAVGQVATGVFALGQLARGGVVVGQLAVGVVSVGMVSLGLFKTVAMIGLAARGTPALYGLMPTKRPHTGLPPLEPAHARMRSGEAGWSRVRVRAGAEAPVVEAGGKALELRLAADLRRAATRAAQSGPVDLFARLRPVDGGWVVDELRTSPEASAGTLGWLVGLGVRFLVLQVVAVVVVMVALLPLWQAAGSPVLRIPFP